MEETIYILISVTELRKKMEDEIERKTKTWTVDHAINGEIEFVYVGDLPELGYVQPIQYYHDILELKHGIGKYITSDNIT